MEVRNYRGWVIWVYGLNRCSYCIRCLSPDGEVYTDWQHYSSSEVALKAAKRLIEQDKLDVRRLYPAVIGLMPQGHTVNSEIQERLAGVEYQLLAIEAEGIGSAMLSILASAALAYLHARIDRGNSS
jgi:hypothetical protein